MTLTTAQGDVPRVLGYVAQRQHVFGELDRPPHHGDPPLGWIAVQTGDLASAHAHVERAVQIARDTGNSV